MVQERAEIDPKDKWNVEALYKDPSHWEKDFSDLKKLSENSWQELNQYKGKIHESAEILKKILYAQFDLSRRLGKVYTYAQLRHDEDLANEKHKNAYDRISSLYFDFSNSSSWVEPEILSLSSQKLTEYLEDPSLAEYKIHLEKIVRMKPHTLDVEKEELLSLSAKSLETPSKAFSLFNNADLKFLPVTNEKGDELELTQGQYSIYMQSQDRTLRKNSFQNLFQGYRGFENTICQLLNGEIQSSIFNARARKYPSTLHAALFPHQIDVNVYTSLIDAVRNNLDKHHQYIALRKKLLGYDELHFYDLYNSLVKSTDLSYSFDEAADLIIDSLHPLGKEYQKQAESGIKEQRWVDRFENKRKRTGAYSGGCFDSMPYILMNYKGFIRDMMTLTHELGHSMHSFYSRSHQPYHYSHYPIFVAEVASTFHEELLFRHLLEKAKIKEEQQYLINQKVDDIRATFFRQAMFAEFEKTLHELAEKDVPLTPGSLKEIYHKLNQDYFGSAFTIDEELGIEFMRIPHFYYNFYVYQYATGIAASYSLVEKVLNEGGGQQYLAFLSSGGSDYPLELLKKAGVDMRTKEPFEVLLGRFSELVEKLELLKIH